MTEQTNHPSYLELDRHCLAGAVDPATAEHVTGCPRCAAYLARHQPALEVPAWVARAVRPLQAEDISSSGPRPRRWVWGMSGMALAAAVCLAFLRPKAQPDRYDGAKGAPAVAVHMQRDGVVRLWDGMPLRAGDRIRLEVMPEEFETVSVFSLPGGRQAPVRLYTGRLRPHAASMLPKAWELDAAPGPEQILVMLAQSEVSPQAVESLLRARDPHEVWAVVLKLPKQSTQE